MVFRSIGLERRKFCGNLDFVIVQIGVLFQRVVFVIMEFVVNGFVVFVCCVDYIFLFWIIESKCNWLVGIKRVFSYFIYVL